MTPAEKRREAHLKRTYGITLEQWHSILANQGGVCAICSREPRGIEVFTTDHDHVTGIVRGILCRYCNHRQVGRHRDPERLRRIADYLEFNPASSVLPSGHVIPKKKKAVRKRDRRNPGGTPK